MMPFISSGGIKSSAEAGERRKKPTRRTSRRKEKEDEETDSRQLRVVNLKSASSPPVAPSSFLPPPHLPSHPSSASVLPPLPSLLLHLPSFIILLASSHPDLFASSSLRFIRLLPSSISPPIPHLYILLHLIAAFSYLFLFLHSSS
jgi:hypothetical protein